ncbi:MAG: acetylxylan esterase, partial [Planctomycetes bacterium]|nr:acetylxylan esterase [Planctomycetota bacterium]
RPSGAVRPPVVVCLQGHTTGAHISIGRAVHPGDAAAIAGERDFALQALRQGFAALALEQRAFGERRDRRPGQRSHGGCTHPAMVALLLGRSMARERTWDVSRAIDLLETCDGLDLARLACMGNSGGGTVTWYASAVEPRIAALMPSCSVCPYGPSIASLDHCPDNYLPGALLHFDMPDLVGLLAPRPCVVVCGRSDDIFPLAGVEAGYRTIAAVYAQAGAADRCRLVVGEGGHRFYAAQGWAALREVTGW